MKRGPAIGVVPQQSAPAKKPKVVSGKPAQKAQGKGAGGLAQGAGGFAGSRESWWDLGVPQMRHAFKVLCTDGLAAALLGERGRVKDEIQKETGTKLTFSNRQDYFPHTAYRVLGIYSDREDGILRALDLVMHRIVEEGDKERREPPPQGPEHLGKEEGEYVYRFCVTKRMSSQIIGTGGANISAIRQETGAKVFVENDTQMGHRMGRIIGQPEHIVACLHKINEFVQWECGEDHFRVFMGLINFGNKDEAVMEEVLREVGLSGPDGKGGGRKGDNLGKFGGSRGDGPDKHGSAPDSVLAQGANAVPVSNNWGRPMQRIQATGLEAELQRLEEELGQFPAETAQVDYLISFLLESAKVDAILREDSEQNGYIRHTESTTDTNISIDDEVELGDGRPTLRRISLTGALPNVYAAQAMIMLRTKQLAYDAAGDNDDWDEDEATDDVEYLTARLAELQEQLAQVEGRA